MHSLDYLVCIIVLAISAALGLYISCFQRKQKLSTGRQYLFGNGKLKGIPLGLSWYSSMIATPMILGLPTEVYVFGTQLIVGCVANILFIPFLHFIVVPVFCGSLVLKSPFKYYELRFNEKIRFLASVIHMIHSIIFMPFALYATILSFSELTQIPLISLSTSVGIVCIIYTLLGGYPAVIWTDIFQSIIMWLSFVFMLVIISNSHSVSEMWNRAESGGRLIFFNMDPSPLARWTFWNATIGICFTYLASSASSGNSIQRLISSANQKEATKHIFSYFLTCYRSIIISCVGHTLTKIILMFIGLFMYGYYYKCDPVQNKEIQNVSKLVPYFISDIMSGLPGFTGLFISGLLCAGLSTLSSDLNTTAGVLYYDILAKIFNKLKLKTEQQDKYFMMFLVFLLGIMTMSIAPLFQYFHYITQIEFVLLGIGYGSLFGLLLLGIMFPWANAKGALCGTVVSLGIMTWIIIGSLLYTDNAKLALPTSVESCLNNNLTELLMTSSTMIPDTQTEPFILYRISFLYCCFLTSMILIIVGMIVSYFTGFTDVSKLNSQLIMPCLRKYTNELPVKMQTTENASQKETL